MLSVCVGFRLVTRYVSAVSVLFEHSVCTLYVTEIYIDYIQY
jgi:hypothetical protein